MKSHLRLAFLASLFPFAAIAGDTTRIDIYRELVRFRSQYLGAEQAFDLTTDQFLRQLVDDPSLFYTELSDRPRLTNEVWWELFLDRLPGDRKSSSRAALDALKWHAGLSKARPGIDVAVDAEAVAAYGGVEVAANALKAGVDPDIFGKASAMNGSSNTVAAGYAVALQILRDQANTYEPADYGRRAIRPEVLERYLAQDYPARIPEQDKHYLADILRYETNQHGTVTDGERRHALPAAYRVARVAAAYTDRDGYLSPRALCRGFEPGPGQPRKRADMDGHRPLCFVAATDRAVQSWYRRELREDHLALKRRHAASSPVMRMIGTVLALVDVVSFIEVVEAAVAEDLAAASAIDEVDAGLASDRASQLSCRIRQ